MLLRPWAALLLTLAALPAADPAALPPLSAANVVLHGAAADASGALHLGNGSLGASAWIETGGDLVIQLNHTDTFSEASRLLKIGRVRVRLDPQPTGAVEQHLRIDEGRLDLTWGPHRLAVLVEPDRPVIRLFGTLAGATAVEVTEDGWRHQRTVLAGTPSGDGWVRKSDALGATWTMDNPPEGVVVEESADVALDDRQAPGALGWYHRNDHSIVDLTLAHQGCAGLPGTFDPLRGRTFGAWIEAQGLARRDARTLRGTVTALDLRLAAPVLMTQESSAWIAAARQAAQTAPAAADAQRATTAHWQAFWQRSWIRVAGDARQPIPENPHPLRTGYDSSGGSRFPGSLAGVTVLERVASPEEILGLAQDATAQGQATAPGERPVAAGAFAAGMTIAAWIRPEAGATEGRIVDRLTAGHEDGFLFDIWPGDALRLIVGRAHLSAAGAVTRGAWQHVAATYDPETGSLALYRDGRRVAERRGEPHPVTAAYQRQRYVNACQNRGEFPPKFNGGMFTVEPRFQDAKLTQDADWRRWGDCYWFQNTRLLYHPMPMAGDLDLMEPLWALYRRPRALAEARAEAWYGVAGSWIPETMTIFGTYANKDYGWKRDGQAPGEVQSPWWRWAWNQTPELIDLLLMRWEWSQDTAFLERELVPQATSLLRYFDTRFRRDDRGLLVIDPAQSAETYWHGVRNDLPNLAGLRRVLPRLAALPGPHTTPELQRLVARLTRALPTIPVGERDTKVGRQRVLLPAHVFEDRTNNCENPELYAVWPFQQYGVGLPDLEMARTTFRGRKFDLPSGWGYDGQVAAVLGLAEDAGRDLLGKTRNSHPAYAFPATWGPNFDWLPDQCHGGNLMTTAQLMLLQVRGDRLLLLPAWPVAWDTDFRLHAPGGVVIEATVRQGVVERLDVTPASAAERITLAAPFRRR